MSKFKIFKKKAVEKYIWFTNTIMVVHCSYRCKELLNNENILQLT